MIDISEVKDPETREELISELTIIMHDDTGKPVQQIQAALNTLTTAELQGAWREYEDKQIAQQHERSKLLVEFDLKAGRIKGTPQNQNALLRIQAAEAAARQFFADIARQLGISNTDTNFRLVYDSFNGSLMDLEDIRSRIASGNLVFIPATEEEQQQWLDQETTALAEFCVDGLRGHLIGRYITSRPLYETFDAQNRSQHIQWMKLLGTDRLNAIKAQIEHNRQVKQQAGIRTAPAPASVDGYAPLPEVNEDGRKIDEAYLLDLSRADRSSQKWQLFRQMCRKYGVNQLTSRLNVA